MSRMFFDDSLPSLVAVVAEVLGSAALEAGLVLRDTSGRLTFFCGPNVKEEYVDRLDQRLRGALGAYAPSDRSAIAHDAAGVADLFVDPLRVPLRIGGYNIRLLDRRVVGADWLRSPSADAEGPPRFVFSSIKGGVGRSTALCVAAAHLASRGLRVLTLDLDLESPGLGSLLLDARTLPPFGVVDALVENGLGGLDAAFIADSAGPSALAVGGGKIDVVPAFGARSHQHPAEVLSKIARAYTENIDRNGVAATILDQLRTLLDLIAKPDTYDIVLIDARAGLHETSAASIIGLGAEVLLFGRDEEQTFRGYSFLLAHLARLRARAEDKGWLERLTPVHAFASADAEQRMGYTQRWEAMVREVGLLPALPAPTAVPLPSGFKDVPWDDSETDETLLLDEPSVLRPLTILRNTEYERFDPLRRRDLLSQAIYEGAFRELMYRIDGNSSNEKGRR